MRKPLLALGGILALALSLTNAHAASTSTSFQVNATVGTACTVSAANLDYGTYNPLAVLPTSVTTTVTVQCTLLATYNVGLSAGSGSGATVAVRKMTKGGDTLAYSLYQDATHLAVWGDSIGTDTIAGVGTGLAVPHVVYGQIPALQNVNSGAYSDTIVVSVNY
ncbi:MAG TPA: spore coat U domain-containing protein [Aromatoleum sp.]|uniref:Csu type fimbrial protein n=1 Tax=Aromatoleum sp. TaxID=2307007 RepID=UPI002B4A7652|nr:spore coat U domain-containing protein [Aromatoleum sp.]HJV24995.1 spore coat U domain-containing protein [Aromatoleum sp.]